MVPEVRTIAPGDGRSGRNCPVGVELARRKAPGYNRPRPVGFRTQSR